MKGASGTINPIQTRGSAIDPLMSISTSIFIDFQRVLEEERMNVTSKNHGMTLIALPNSKFFNSLNVHSHTYLSVTN